MTEKAESLVKMALILLIIILMFVAPLPVNATIPATEELTIERPVDYDVLQYITAYRFERVDGPTNTFIWFYDAYFEIPPDSERVILYSVAAPMHTVFSSVKIEVNDTHVPYSIRVWETNSTYDPFQKTFEISNLRGSHVITTIVDHEVKSLFFNLTIVNHDPSYGLAVLVSFKVNFTKFVFNDFKITYYDESERVVDLVVLPPFWYPDATGTETNVITVYAVHEFEVAYEGQVDCEPEMYVMPEFERDWTYDGSYPDIYYTIPLINETKVYRDGKLVTSVRPGNKYVVKTKWQLGTWEPPGTIFLSDGIYSQVEVSFDDVPSTTKMLIDWGKKNIAYTMSIPRLFTEPYLASYNMTIWLENAVAKNFELATPLGEIWNWTCTQDGCFIGAHFLEFTETYYIEWEDNMTVALCDYSTLDLNKTCLNGYLLSGDEIAFVDASGAYEIDSVYVRLYDAEDLIFSQNKLGTTDNYTVTFAGVPAGEYVRRLVLERYPFGHAVVEDTVIVGEYLELGEVETSPYETSEKIVINGVAIKPDEKVSVKLNLGTYYPRTEGGALNWTFRVHSALYKQTCLEDKPYKLVLGLVHKNMGGKDFFYTDPEAGLEPDIDMPNKVFTASLTEPATMFIEGEPLVALKDSTALTLEKARFENYTGFRVVSDVALLTIKFPATVTVKVADRNGKPVPDATVNLALTKPAYAAPEYTTTTNSSGVAVFEKVEPVLTDYTLTVVYRGYTGSVNLPVRDDIMVTVQMDFAIEEVPETTTTTVIIAAPTTLAEYTMLALVAILVIAVIVFAVAVLKSRKEPALSLEY